jgi:hypothetical protein
MRVVVEFTRCALSAWAAISLGLAGLIGILGLREWPFPGDNVFLAAVHARKPWLFDGLGYAKRARRYLSALRLTEFCVCVRNSLWEK